ncbi:MAG: PhoH family protein [Myxococcota bacterium]|jgi:phosphate starvation-inducible PhoH-like protein|nr:PhoH family protein [Myxococcota bacterium]
MNDREPRLANPAEPTQRSITFDDNHAAATLYGDRERHLRLLSAQLGVKVHARGNTVRLEGRADDIDRANNVLEELYGLVKRGQTLRPVDVREAVRMLEQAPDTNLSEVTRDVLDSVGSRHRIRAKNLSQRKYVELIRENDIVFATGPAGTGKTYLAMAMAIAALNRQDVSRVVLTRPAVEAGEKLGFLPGDLAEKVNPYLRPLYDALHDMMHFEKVGRLMERGVIEVAPLAFMRGRTLNDAFVILDEAQNTTPEQMKMFLTRLGFNSVAVVTGDITQSDLGADARSGLVEALEILRDVEGIGFTSFTKQDVVRHPLVQSIVRAYEDAELEQQELGQGTRSSDPKTP